MPFVTVKLIEGVFTPEEKQEMVARLTDTMVEIGGEAMRQVTWVTLEEVKSGDWGIAGNTGDGGGRTGDPQRGRGLGSLAKKSVARLPAANLRPSASASTPMPSGIGVGRVHPNGSVFARHPHDLGSLTVS